MTFRPGPRGFIEPFWPSDSLAIVWRPMRELNRSEHLPNDRIAPGSRRNPGADLLSDRRLNYGANLVMMTSPIGEMPEKLLIAENITS